MKILDVGAAGKTGSAVVEQAVAADGYEVIPGGARMDAAAKVQSMIRLVAPAMPLRRF